MNNITKEALLQTAIKELIKCARELDQYGSLESAARADKVIASIRAADLSAQESKPVAALIAKWRWQHITVPGAKFTDYDTGYVHAAVELEQLMLAPAPVSAQDASSKDVKPDTIHEWDSRSALFGKCERCGCSAISLEANCPCKGSSP